MIKSERYKITLLIPLALIACYLISKTCLLITGLPNTTQLFSWITFLKEGYSLCVLSSAILVIIPIVSVWFFAQKGFKRWISYWLIASWVAILFLLYTASFILIKYDEIHALIQPLYILKVLAIAPKNSLINQHALTLLITSTTVLLLAGLGAYLSRKMFKEQKVFGQARFATPFDLKKSNFYGRNGVIIGKDYGEYLSVDGGESILVTAPTGSGKTTGIAIPNLLNWTSSVVVNDLKGELFRITAKHRKHNLGTDVICFSPSTKLEGAKAYNPFFYVSQNSDYMIRDIQLIAEILIPATKHGDSFWYQSSRDLFMGLSLYLFETKGMASLPDIHDLIKQESFVEWLDEVVDTVELLAIKQSFSSIIDSDKKTRKNIIKDFQSRMSLFSDPIIRRATSSNNFDIRQLRKIKMSIYINIPPFDTERLSPLITLFWAQLIQQMTLSEPKKDEQETVLALLDEFSHMSRINKLKDGLSFLRSYNMRFVVLIQYLTQLRSVYGPDDSRGFLNTKVKIVFALNDYEDARYFSSALGHKTVKVKTTSFNSGYGSQSGSRASNHSYQSQPLMTSDQLMCLSPSSAIALIEGASPIHFKKSPYFKEHFFCEVLREKLRTGNN